jgi:hypothetical protein
MFPFTEDLYFSFRHYNVRCTYSCYHHLWSEALGMETRWGSKQQRQTSSVPSVEGTFKFARHWSSQCVGSSLRNIIGGLWSSNKYRLDCLSVSRTFGKFLLTLYSNVVVNRSVSEDIYTDFFQVYARVFWEKNKTTRRSPSLSSNPSCARSRVQ